MKNTLFRNLAILMALSVAASCTEEIEFDLNSSDPQVVIEGSVPTDGQPIVLKIFHSINFDEDNEFPAVVNASVEIADNLGNIVTIDESAIPGIYSSNELSGLSGHTYTMAVEADGRLFSAASTVPGKVQFDSLIVIKSDGGGAGGPGGFGSTTNYDVRVMYTDPEDESNYYRFVERVNGEMEADYIFDDRLKNGKSTQQALLRFNRVFEAGDTLQVIMQCIDRNVYEYFNSFGNLMGGPANSSTPANPYTNIEGAVLGYFSAHTYEIKQWIIR